MSKDELKQHLEYFVKIQSEFIPLEKEYKLGENKRVRNSALTELRSILNRFERYVLNSQELYNFLTRENAKEDQKAIIWNEFISISYFNDDISSAIDRINVLLKELE